MKQYNVIIADDHALVRDGVRRLLEAKNEYKVIAEADSAEQLLCLCKSHTPDLLIMDLSMPGMGGVEAIRRIRPKWPDLKILVFSMYKNTPLIKGVLEAGAHGYVTKSSKNTVLEEGVSTVMVGKSFISPDISETLNLESMERDFEPLRQLSVRELEVFRRVAEGLTTEKIAEKLFISEKTVANHVSLIRKKLKVSTIAEMIHIAFKEGLLIADHYS